MEAAGKRSIRVTLLGQNYNLLAAGDPAAVERLAERVDTLMHEIARKVPNADSSRIAVLACLHLADRLEDLEKSLSTLKDRVDRKTEEFSMLLNQAMEE